MTSNGSVLAFVALAALLCAAPASANPMVMAQQEAAPSAPAPMAPMPGMPGTTATADPSAPGRLNTPAHVVRRPKLHRSDLKIAMRLGFKKVSDLTTFPPFYPGLGIVTVRPDTLSLGPFRCFDRAGKLIASVYMPTIKEMNDEHKKWDYVHGLPKPVDHVTIYYHPGHPGVPTPHYHVVLWHVTKAQEKLVAK